MAKILYGVIAAMLSIALVNSLTCNKCSVGLFGYCIGSSTITCSGNQTYCYTGKAAFTGIPSFSGFSQQGCSDSTNCNQTFTNTLIGVSYTVTTTCCNITNQCNPVNLNGATSAQLSMTAAVGTALVAFMWNSWVH